MSPASKTKSKDKASSKMIKEQHKASPKPYSAPSSSLGNGAPPNAYNPVSGTFHSLETSTITSSPTQNNGRFRNIEETDEPSGSFLGIGVEYDSLSNNDSCSGESEDLKEKTTRPESIPGSSDTDKREKIRQKNEKKHQRQRERRAQELHERCSGYLMSRKLEALAQQLVAMGFSLEGATMALMLNDGNVEQAVGWLLEGGEELSKHKETNLNGGSNLKIDIGEELSTIAEMELRFKCSKQEVERAVVACEGDLEKAKEILRASPKPEQSPISPLKAEDNHNSITPNSNKSSVLSKMQPKIALPLVMQQRRDDRDIGSIKVPSPELGNRNASTQRRIQRPQLTGTEKRWAYGNPNSPVPFSMASTLQVVPSLSKQDSKHVLLGNEGKIIPTGAVREPVVMMQRPQTIAANPNPITTINTSISPSTSRYSSTITSGTEMCTKPNGIMGYHQAYQYFGTSSVETATPAGWGGLRSSTSNASSPTPSFPIPPSLGLFKAYNSTGISSSSSPVDWNTGGSMWDCDYNNIDWSLESPSLWSGVESCVKGRAGRSSSNGVCVPTLQQGNANVVRNEATTIEPSSSSSSSSSSHEWTSPFTGTDLFHLSRQFVIPPPF